MDIVWDHLYDTKLEYGLIDQFWGNYDSASHDKLGTNVSIMIKRNGLCLSGGNSKVQTIYIGQVSFQIEWFHKRLTPPSRYYIPCRLEYDLVDGHVFPLTPIIAYVYLSSLHI
jgi:hypothetical protein